LVVDRDNPRGASCTKPDETTDKPFATDNAILHSNANMDNETNDNSRNISFPQQAKRTILINDAKDELKRGLLTIKFVEHLSTEF